MELGLAVAAFLAGLISFTIVREFRARRALAEARALQHDLQVAIDTIPTIVWSTWPDGTVDFMNRAWREFTGIAGEDAAQRWVETLHPDEAVWVQETRNASIGAGKAYELDARLRRSDGTYRWVLRRAVPLRNERGEIVKWYGTGTDIDDLKRAQRAARRARERRFTAALEERTRVAREIHDTLLQGFTGIALQLAAITRRAADPETASALAEVVGLAQRTLDDARQAIWDLRAPTVAGPFPTALRDAAETAVRGVDLTLDFQMRGIARPLTPQVEATLARVLQESTANTIKHAGAHALRVRLSYTPRSVRLSISDDGRGFEVDPEFRAYGGHWGLLGMKERAAELGGTLRVHSAPGCGTSVAFRIPISPNGELPA
jgi:PAS domain S-box-containing protein